MLINMIHYLTVACVLIGYRFDIDTFFFMAIGLMLGSAIACYIMHREEVREYKEEMKKIDDSFERLSRKYSVKIPDDEGVAP